MVIDKSEPSDTNHPLGVLLKACIHKTANSTYYALRFGSTSPGSALTRKRKMVYSSENANVCRRRSDSLLHCGNTGPVTPDSVVGTNILLDGCGGDGTEAHKVQMPHLSPTHDMSSSQLLHILQTEASEQYQVTPNYLHSSVLITSPQEETRDQGVSERCRRRTCEWMYDICDYFGLNREVVGIALFYVDRYFTITFEGPSGQVPVKRGQFQLIALTGLYIAVKLHGESRRESLITGQSSGSPGQSTTTIQPWSRLKFNVPVCASISRDQFTSRQIEECEVDILRTLNWHCNPIVPSGTIIDSLLLYLPSTICARNIDGNMNESLTICVYDCAKYLAELSVSVPALSLVYKPSVVAFASILYALDTVKSKSTSCDSFVLSDQSRQEYEKLIVQVSSHHFDREKGNVEKARKILSAICPCRKLSELFPPPLLTPKSPTSVSSL